MESFFIQTFKIIGLNILSSLFSFQFFVVIILILFLYKREQQCEFEVLGSNKRTLAYKMVESSMAGFIGGVVASLIIVWLGIIIDIDSFMYLWYIALILALVNPRYLCFSYAGGILSLISLITGVPKIDVSGLMILVALLHFVESILILIDGYKGSIPVAISHKRGVSGAFLMERFWAIPLVIIAFGITPAGEIVRVNLNTPGWWPLFKPNFIDQNSPLLITPIFAALGYGDLAVNDEPKVVSKKSATYLSLFSISLFIFAGLSYKIYILKWIAALFAPIAHESIIIFQQKVQKTGKSVFLPEHPGIKVLDVVEGSVAQKIGIKPGDTIMAINNQTIYSEKVLYDIFEEPKTYLWVQLKDKNGKEKFLEYQDFKGIEKLGIIVITKDTRINFVLDSDQYFRVLKLLIKKLFRKNEV